MCKKCTNDCNFNLKHRVFNEKVVKKEIFAKIIRIYNSTIYFNMYKRIILINLLLNLLLK